MNSTQTLSKNKKKRILSGDFSGGPWLGLQASSVRDTGSIPGQGIKILYATWLAPLSGSSLCLFFMLFMIKVL